MNRFIKAGSALIGVLLCLLGGGCHTAQMKGTPFYTGEYAGRRGPAEQRINAWPLLYYRDPALSVLWPLFEHTDDHLAVRPVFSVYGLDASNREYNVLWPLVQFDQRNGEHRIFPVFWGDDHFVAFPLYWRFGEPRKRDGGTEVLFPFYWRRPGTIKSLFVSLLWMSGRDANSRWRVLTPLIYHGSNETSTVLVTPLWSQGRTDESDWRALAPLFYWDREKRTLLSPLWAQWRARSGDRYVAPWALSWAVRRRDITDLWLFLALAHASWGNDRGRHHVFPIYYRDPSGKTLLTPLFGWSGSGGFYYPVTPLVGVRTGEVRGSWAFPIYNHYRDTKDGEVFDRVLLLSGHSTNSERTHTWFFPLFSFRNFGPLENSPKRNKPAARYGKSLWCALFCWYRNEATVGNRRHGIARQPGGEASPPPRPAAESLVRTDGFGHGAFPLWSYSSTSTPVEGRSTTKGSLLLLLYNYKRQVGSDSPAKTSNTNDYTRARVLWRLWHYERLNGAVSIDVFPAFTYDRKPDGFKKTSLLWRLFRHERSPGGATKLDLLFVPLKR